MVLRSLKAILIPSFGLFLALLLLEIIVRVFLSGAPKAPWNDRPSFYYAAEGAPAMQDFPLPALKDEKTFRIAVVGDSFTFAPYMQFTDAFPQKLEAMLNLNRNEVRGDVVNYGVPAYSTTHEVGVVDRALKEGADLILLEITLNDPEIKSHRPTGILENMVDKFAPKKASGLVAKIAKRWKTFGFALERIYNTQSHQAYIDYFKDLFENPRSWNEFSQAIKKIVARCKESGKPLRAVVFPLFGIPMDDRYPFYEIHKKVDALLTSLEVSHLDLSSSFKGIPLERLQVIPGVDRHPNEIAHRMAAEEIYLWLEREKAFPDQLKITDRYATRLGIENQRRLDVDEKNP